MKATTVGITLTMMAALTVGCGDEKKPADGKDGKAAASASAEAPPDPEKIDVKTEADFEDEADEKITPDTLDAELDKLAAEIEGDKD